MFTARYGKLDGSRKKGGELMLETKELKNVEIFEAGNWKGKDYTEQDLDQAIENFNNKVIDPYLNLDHDPDWTEEQKRTMSVISLGSPKRLWREGKKLIADFKDVPKKIAELINAGALKKKSVEWWKNYKHANGTVYKNVLEAVSFFGGNGVPAVSSLNDAVQLYKLQNQSQQNEGEKIKIYFKEESLMENNISKDEIVLTKAEYQSLLENKVSVEKFKLDNDSSRKEIEMLKNTLSEKSKELDTMKAEKVELEKLKADVEKQRSENIKGEAVKFVEELVKNKKQLPKFNDFNVSQYIRFKNANDEEGLKIWKEQLESNVINKNFEKSSFKDNQDGQGTFEKPSARFKNNMTDEEVKSVYDEQEEAIQEHMKANNKSWNESAKALGLIN